MLLITCFLCSLVISVTGVISAHLNIPQAVDLSSCITLACKLSSKITGFFLSQSYTTGYCYDTEHLSSLIHKRYVVNVSAQLCFSLIQHHIEFLSKFSILIEDISFQTVVLHKFVTPRRIRSHRAGADYISQLHPRSSSPEY